MTFEEIAKELKLSRARVLQIYKGAINKLSHPRNKDKWQAIFETLETIKQERIQRENLTQGERK
ncbi:sigma factor-like helix-turn-helix DNA-binding protein [Campylobacter sp. US33a]|uniref:sigma factor-like helix-turn-helix DNA-binding protein n=1 Tax=Campylobacter sp. US33a TaxID=2498120 RepID=UPI0010673BC7|nr:sigma factor-like helix-turn-helix DNA-binding protein [Campylobacter sp. US33a]TEY01256.1 RNA polymerase subunit sigma-70 [Campylobacter sp. US33a]